MVKALIIGLLGAPMLAIFWPAGLAMIMYGLITLIIGASKIAKQHLQDVHTIAQHIEEKERKGL